MPLSDIRLETDRLILRVPCAEDFDAFAEMQAHPDAARFIGGHVTRAEAWRRFLWQPGAWLVQGFGMFGVVEKSSGLWMGQIGPWKPEGWPGNEIGYGFHPRAWGKGYATEAGTAAIRAISMYLGRMRRTLTLAKNGAGLQEAAKASGVFWKQEREFLRQARSWSLAELDKLQPEVLAADKACKTAGSPDSLIAERLALTIAGRARRLGL